MSLLAFVLGAARSELGEAKIKATEKPKSLISVPPRWPIESCRCG
jgi:hypothetical protein